MTRDLFGSDDKVREKFFAGQRYTKAGLLESEQRHPSAVFGTRGAISKTVDQ